MSEYALRNQICHLGLKIRRNGQYYDARIAAIEKHLGLPTPPKPARLEGESPAPDRDSNGNRRCE